VFGSLVDSSDRDWHIALKRLAAIDLISLSVDASDGSRHSLDAHPLIREYFVKQLREQQPEAFRAAHSRLFDHLCENTPYRPDGLEGLQPLFQAVVHGCLAGRQQEACDNVYNDRILRGTGHDGFYSIRKLGAIGADLAAVVAFFDQPWSVLSPNLSEPDQAWLLNQAAFRLRALGRLTEARQPMRVSGEMEVAAEEWKRAATGYGNLSELELTLGELPSAVAEARRAIGFADRSRDEFWRMGTRATAADALHHSGDRDAAQALFAEAERMQQQRQPEFNLLYSVAGFSYCNLLLVPAERAAWQTILGGSVPGSRPVSEKPDDTTALAACDEAQRRGNKMLEWRVPNDSLLDIAVDNLTLARAALYRAILKAKNTTFPASLPPTLAAAVNGLRQAGQQDDLPNALLTAALAHHVAGDAESASRDLNEALQIAQRGPMPLYLADVHLHRARLFFREKSYPWTSPEDDLAAAEKLIRDCGYHRRDEELADAKRAILGEGT
jgi:tetratricopeptide (TPR) repeat protein